SGSLEDSQRDLAEVIAEIIKSGSIPIVLGGGHETAYGEYLGYVGAGVPVGIINLDAHLDVRPPIDGRGHSGSPFRQAWEHSTYPLAGYACLGAQPQSVSREHFDWVRERGGVVSWCEEVRHALVKYLEREITRLAGAGCQIYVSLDADVISAA